jgi:hypothetical protein
VTSDAPPQKHQDSDSTQAAFMAMHLADVTRPVLPLAPGRVGFSSPTAAQDASMTTATTSSEQPQTTEPLIEGKDAVPSPQPVLECAPPQASSTASGPLAFAARLSTFGTAEVSAAYTSSAQDSGSRAQASPQIPLRHPATPVPVLTEDSAPGSKNGDKGGREAPAGGFSKPEVSLSSGASAVQHQTTAGAHLKISGESPAPARVEPVLEMPSAPAGSSRDITVRVSDATEKPTDIRFVERNGEVHVSVRSADSEVAQTLRSGLNDLAGRLESKGIQTEVWRPGAESSSSPNDSHHSSADPDGSAHGGGQGGSQNGRRHPQNQPKPRWVEELETSAGNQTKKEASQPLWQV